MAQYLLLGNLEIILLSKWTKRKKLYQIRYVETYTTVYLVLKLWPDGLKLIFFPWMVSLSRFWSETLDLVWSHTMHFYLLVLFDFFSKIQMVITSSTSFGKFKVLFLFSLVIKVVNLNSCLLRKMLKKCDKFY